MKLSASAFSPRLRPSRTAGFTLVELLVVIGIIGVLVGILLPVILSAQKQATRDRLKMDLQAIANALEAYKQDFGDYPRQSQNARGQRLLGWALLGNGAAAVDGADGPGFRTVAGGKVWGPYLPIDKFRASGDDILDAYDNVIEYFPRWRQAKTKIVPKTGGLPVPTKLFGTSPADFTNSITLYDFTQASDGQSSGTVAAAVNYLRVALGDSNLNDVIDASESLKDAPSFLLVTKGPRKTWTDPAEIKKNIGSVSEVSNLQ